ncbi:recombinase family protein [Butyrivibrio sp. NC2007]|uniref:recombinase family protein n=1 Tax=Butyrivibrio sp. NC2007 TaxID=1280683 RepID=UPI0003B3E07E|nr:recombinase family protein [Butyrivibrio sp. NC2007]
METIYGYARCSTDESRQDIDRQRRELKNMGIGEDKLIFWEYESGRKLDRAEFQKLLDIIQPGDSIAVTEVSRLTRSTKHLCEILQIVQERHIRLIIGNFDIDCRKEDVDPMTKGMLMMWGVFSEMERDIISQRVKSGIENARSKGKHIGRPVITPERIPLKFYQHYPLYKRHEITITDFAKILNCSRTTVYKYISLVNQ